MTFVVVWKTQAECEQSPDADRSEEKDDLTVDDDDSSSGVGVEDIVAPPRESITAGVRRRVGVDSSADDVNRTDLRWIRSHHILSVAAELLMDFS